MDTQRNSFVVPAIILSAGFLLASAAGAYTFYKVRTFENTLSVTGSAKKSVQADSVKLIMTVSRTVSEGLLQGGYAQIANDSKAVSAFLNENGVKSEEVTVQPVFVEERYQYTNTPGPREYTLRQEFTVQSGEVQKITELAKNTASLVNKGIFLNVLPPQYYYTKLAELRVSLLGDAVRDAKARADQLAESSGRSVGVLKAASSGVVQVLAPNSIEVSDYGQYDTSSIEKEVMVTVRATFLVE